MHIPTHILSGWCASNLFQLSARERLFCMIAASVEDVDGLGRIVSEELYWSLHHKLGHCALFGVAISSLLAAFSKRRLTCFLLYIALFHVHLVLDAFGSGPGWSIYYVWPFSDWEFNTEWAWEFFSWQNITAFTLLLGWMLWIAKRQHRTPLELIAPRLNQQFVRAITSTPAASPD